MVKFYAEKIRTGAINQNTGTAWKAEDVPKLWRLKVENELKR
jgi:hypothetical protein